MSNPKQGQQALAKMQPTDIIMATVEKARGTMRNLLPPTMNLETFMAKVRFAVASSPNIQGCDRLSVVQAVLSAAKMGLDVDGGPMGHGYLVPFKGKCNFIPGYKGMVMLAKQAGVVEDMQPVLVHEADKFVPEEGEEPRIHHRPFVPRKVGETRGEVIAVYTRVTLPSGKRVIKGLMYLPDILRREKKALAASGPWKTDREAMIAKSSVRTAFNTLGVPSTESTLRLREAIARAEVAEERPEELDSLPPVDGLPGETPASGVDALEATLSAREAEPVSSEPGDDGDDYKPEQPPEDVPLPTLGGSKATASGRATK